ncbi:MAG: Tm-1-like ATP-binding domain-containing protein, partial [Candidatus Latescibacterota bacterium]|nr:Tm-1-like ATP-binding domain-containing protein [Candidatus Latescibacterota bacterium]
MPTPRTIALIGAFDTKGTDYAYLRKCIRSRGHHTLTIDTSVLTTTDRFVVDVSASDVAAAGGRVLADLRNVGDRGEAMKVMAAGAAVVAARLFGEGRFHGILGMGGTGGTSVISAAMRALPLGVPKICVSTAASGDTSAFVGLRDVVLTPSIVDVAGVNSISRGVYARAAGAICGMVETDVETGVDERPVVAASMFGNTTTCVDACVDSL